MALGSTGVRGVAASLYGTTSPLVPDLTAVGGLVGDLTFIIVGNKKTNSPDDITSTGYTVDTQQTNVTPAPDLWLSLLRRFFVAGDDDPSVANASTPSNGWGLFTFAATGIDQTSPIDATAVGSSGTTTAPIPTGITTVTPGALVISTIVSDDGNAGGISITTSQGFTTLASGSSYQNTTRAICFAVTYKVITTPGAVTCPTYATGSSKDYAAITLALRPAFTPSMNPLILQAVQRAATR